MVFNSKRIYSFFMSGEMSSDGANLAKVIATLYVVMVHSNNIFSFSNVAAPKYFNGIITTVASGVPVFFLLSGFYLMNKETFCFKANIIKKLKTLVVPYVLFMLLYTLLNMIGYMVVPRMFDNFTQFGIYDWFNHLIGIPFIKNPLYYEPLWFLRDLIILNLLTFFLYHWLSILSQSY